MVPGFLQDRCKMFRISKNSCTGYSKDNANIPGDPGSSAATALPTSPRLQAPGLLPLESPFRCHCSQHLLLPSLKDQAPGLLPPGVPAQVPLRPTPPAAIPKRPGSRPTATRGPCSGCPIQPTPPTATRSPRSGTTAANNPSCHP
ncbi:translation initiation factor IF-2-like [Chiloscyllium plagiosum]|uniref:translation initiation factor IF-2-like n=1 Tax=Chiloscyllium plagiosum TaxID=36176 RepID=UPI001CB83D0E|nr:translation initiation factor IF-2-like [Chiloscyllium plagiosum]